MKQKIFVTLLAICFTIPFVFSQSFSYTYQGREMYFKILDQDAKTCALIAYYANGYRFSGDLIIPTIAELSSDEYSVISIGDNAFSRCSGLTSVTIPNSVTSIGSGAFFGCSGLTGQLIIPNSVTSIGNSAFECCSGLTGQLIIPNSVTSIGFAAFHGCSSLTSVTIGNSVTSIGFSAFHGCSSLTSVTIGNSVTSIGERAFYECSGLTSVTIGNSVTSIGVSAFHGCSSLTSLTIGNSVTSIGFSAFKNCSRLKSIAIPNSVTSIGNEAFYCCDGLTSVTIGNSVISIGERAFKSCSRLKSIAIPNSVTSIGNEAFSDCSGCTNIIIEDGTENLTIGRDAFYKYNLLNLYLGRNLSSGDFDTSSLKKLTIGNSVTLIRNHEFKYCSGLTELIIEDGSNELTFGENVFNSNLQSLYVGRNFTCSSSNSSYHPFKGQRSLEKLTIGNSVTSIGSSAFYNCSGLTSVSIGNSVTSIGNDAFYGCTKLTKAEFASIESLCAIEFKDLYANPLYYAKHLYIGDDEIKDLVIPNSVTAIGSYTFRDCTGLTSVSIGNSVTAICGGAFNGCSGLIYVSIGDSVTSIGNYSFYECSGLTSVTIGNSVTSVGDYAFSYCSSLASISIPNSVTSVGDYAFSYCSSLTSVSIPNSVTSISNYAFYNCSSLTSVSIPNSVTSISNYAFYNCYGLTSVTIGNSVTSIGNYAFCVCSGLTSIKIPKSVTSIGARAFYGCNNVESVECYAVIPPTAESSFTDYTYITAKLKVPFSSIDAYKSNSVWSKFRIIESLEGNDDENDDDDDENNDEVSKYLTFSYWSATAKVTGFNADELVDIDIPETVNHQGRDYSVTGITASAFAGKSQLRAVTIPSTVTAIDPGAFLGCQNLETVNYGCVSVSTTSSHQSIPVFKYCPNLKTLNILPSVESLPPYLFNGVAIEELIIPDNVTTIGRYCFAEADNLTEIHFGKGLSRIDGASFDFGNFNSNETTIYCNSEHINDYDWLYPPMRNRNVTTIDFGEDVAVLDDWAFFDVTTCKDIYCHSEVPPVVATSEVLKKVDKENCALHVPIHLITTYRHAPFWGDFRIIQGDASGMVDINDNLIDSSNDVEPMKIYSISGQLLHQNAMPETLEQLAPGLYIIRQGKTVKKIVVK